MQYLGNKAEELGSGKGATNTPPIFISSHVERCDVVCRSKPDCVEGGLKLNIEQATMERFEEPQYVTQRAHQLRDGLGNTNMILRVGVGGLFGISYNRKKVLRYM